MHEPCIVRYDVCSLTMCEKGEKTYCKRQCIERDCKICGTHKLETKLSYLENVKQNVTWLEWQEKKLESGSFLKTYQGSAKQLLAVLCAGLQSYAIHLFRAKWEYRQFQNIIKVPPPQSVVTVMDFGQNYRCTYQEEPQFLNWQYRQATVHPIVSYYRCPSNCGETVQEDIIFISPDLRHDSCMVELCSSEALSHLRRERNLEVRHVIEFSDTCAAQYRG